MENDKMDWKWTGFASDFYLANIDDLAYWCCRALPYAREIVFSKMTCFLYYLSRFGGGKFDYLRIALKFQTDWENRFKQSNFQTFMLW